MNNLIYPDKKKPSPEDFHPGQEIKSLYRDNKSFEVIDVSPESRKLVIRQIDQKNTQIISIDDLI